MHVLPVLVLPVLVCCWRLPAYLQLLPELWRRFVQLPCRVDGAHHHAPGHAQLAADVQAADGFIAAVEAALYDVLWRRPQALQHGAVLHLAVEQRKVCRHCCAGGDVPAQHIVVVALCLAAAAAK
jgi:hypothetical protein